MIRTSCVTTRRLSQVMPSAELSRRVGKVVAYPPHSEMSDQQRREFHGPLLHADRFEDLPSKWQAAILAEQARPRVRVVGGD
jgi:S-methylmethionine-dependent homocysteine/selenocysteine methylase